LALNWPDFSCVGPAPPSKWNLCALCESANVLQVRTILKVISFGWIAILGIPLLAGSLGCQGGAWADGPFVQHSDLQDARWNVDLNRTINGIYRPYFPRCTDKVQVGDTVAFRNFLPEIPANVSSLSSPDGATLFSPNLVRPYNYVSGEDPNNDACRDGVCEAYSFWRHTFDAPGIYDWVDTNQGEPGRKVVDPYYGTVSYVGVDPNTPLASICVPDAQGEGCAGVCCQTETECGSGTTCIKSSFEAVGRCLTPRE
jgi:hypothetical protein